MEFIEELETIYMDANEEIKKSLLLPGGSSTSQQHLVPKKSARANQNKDLLYEIEEDEEVKYRGDNTSPTNAGGALVLAGE